MLMSIYQNFLDTIIGFTDELGLMIQSSGVTFQIAFLVTTLRPLLLSALFKNKEVTLQIASKF